MSETETCPSCQTKIPQAPSKCAGHLGLLCLDPKQMRAVQQMVAFCSTSPTQQRVSQPTKANMLVLLWSFLQTPPKKGTFKKRANQMATPGFYYVVMCLAYLHFEGDASGRASHTPHVGRHSFWCFVKTSTPKRLLFCCHSRLNHPPPTHPKEKKTRRKNKHSCFGPREFSSQDFQSEIATSDLGPHRK